MKMSWFVIASTATALVVLLVPLAPAYSAAPPQISITPSSVYSYESENFFVTVNNAGPLRVISISVTTPLALQVVGTDQVPDRSHLITRNQSSYTASWFGTRSTNGVLIPPGNSATFGFSLNVPGPGTYNLAVTAGYFDGSSASLGTLLVVVSDPSMLGLVDARSLVYVLGAAVILLPVAQWVTLLTLRQFRSKGSGEGDVK